MKILSEILDEIERAWTNRQRRGGGYCLPDQRIDVGALVKALRRAMMWIPDQSKDQANVDLAAILNGEKTNSGEKETK